MKLFNISTKADGKTYDEGLSVNGVYEFFSEMNDPSPYVIHEQLKPESYMTLDEFYDKYPKDEEYLLDCDKEKAGDE